MNNDVMSNHYSWVNPWASWYGWNKNEKLTIPSIISVILEVDLVFSRLSASTTRLSLKTSQRRTENCDPRRLLLLRERTRVSLNMLPGITMINDTEDIKP